MRSLTAHYRLAMRSTGRSVGECRQYHMTHKPICVWQRQNIRWWTEAFDLFFFKRKTAYNHRRSNICFVVKCAAHNVDNDDHLEYRLHIFLQVCCRFNDEYKYKRLLSSFSSSFYCSGHFHQWYITTAIGLLLSHLGKRVGGGGR